MKTKLADVSIVTAVTNKIFGLAKWLSPMKILSLFSRLFRSRSELTRQEVNDPRFTKRRAIAIELYMISWWVIEIISVSIISTSLNNYIWNFILLSLATIRLIEIFQVTVNTSLFDAINGRPDGLVASRTRMVLLSGLNFIEIALCYGVIYAININILNGAKIPLDAFYFSVITQLTIGYGDICPTEWLRLVSAIQGMTSLLFVVLVFARYISALPSINSLFDEPVDKIRRPRIQKYVVGVRGQIRIRSIKQIDRRV